jgi:hypothetical protein
MYPPLTHEHIFTTALKTPHNYLPGRKITEWNAHHERHAHIKKAWRKRPAFVLHDWRISIVRTIHGNPLLRLALRAFKIAPGDFLNPRFPPDLPQEFIKKAPVQGLFL